MSEWFLLDGDRRYSFARLLTDLQALTAPKRYVTVADNEPYPIFLAFIHSLLGGYPIELLDGDFSAVELAALGITAEQLAEPAVPAGASLPVMPQTVAQMTAHLSELRVHPAQTSASVTLYTSGTTGRPKSVTHAPATLLRNVRTGEAYRQDVWAFAYNPTHMAGLQVLVQALLNGNTMVYAFAGRQRALANLITAYGVTHISATATYYRNVLVELKDSYPSVKRVTFGGEPFDPRLAEQLKARFPHARMTNIYASTEAGTLFSGDGESFAVLPEMVSLIRIDEENDELLLHRSLLGDSQTFVTEQDWFRTGDLVERLPDGRFRFKARQSEMINIGGYKVNPGEVEQLLRTVPGVLDVRVSGVANKVTGHILLAEVVKGADIDDLSLKIRIKQYAAEHLQAWKVPRIIEIVPELRVSRTGKKART